MVSKARKDHARATKNNPKSTYSANDTPIEIQPSLEVRNAEPGSLVEDYRQFEKRILHFDEKYKDLHEAYEKLQTNYNSKVKELEDLQEEYEKLQTSYDSKVKELEGKVHVASSNKFSTVFLDGDGYLFHDNLLREGPDGGSRAAHLLHTAIKEDLLKIPDCVGVDVPVMVFIFVNFEGVAQVLKSRGVIRNVADFRAFTQSFALNQCLFNFIDVGFGKEKADHKIKEMLPLFVNDSQCKQVYFGGCHDGGYLPVLAPYKYSKTASKIALIDYHSMLPDYRNLNLRVVTFPSIFNSKAVTSTGVFTSSSLPSRQVITPPPTGLRPLSLPPPPPPPSAPESLPSPTLSPSISRIPSPPTQQRGQSWATISRPQSERTVIDITPTPSAPVSKILFNAASQRLDTPLPKADRQNLQQVEMKIKKFGKLCNEFHFNGKCANDDCEFYHGERLHGAERLALRVKARNWLCSWGSHCHSHNCFFGHHCPSSIICHYGENCHFKNLHGMDLKPKFTEDENGNVEMV